MLAGLSAATQVISSMPFLNQLAVGSRRRTVLDQ
jgi:hypothetical protein